MVNLILKYLESPLRAFLPFVQTVDVSTYRLMNGVIYKGLGQEKKEVGINDQTGNSIYIRTNGQAKFKDAKSFSSCDKEYIISQPCRIVFYSFGIEDFAMDPDKITNRLHIALNKIDFDNYKGTSTNIQISISGSGNDMEKIFMEETGKKFEGSPWPVLCFVDFNLIYTDANCDLCDIGEDEINPVVWDPIINPENCEVKAICEAVEKCQVIKYLLTTTEYLQEQIDNFPENFTCDDVAGCESITNIQEAISDLQSQINALLLVDKTETFTINGNTQDFTELPVGNYFIFKEGQYLTLGGRVVSLIAKTILFDEDYTGESLTLIYKHLPI